MFGIILAGIGALALISVVTGAVVETVSQARARKNNSVETKNPEGSTPTSTEDRKRKRVVTDTAELSADGKETPVIDEGVSKDITVEQAVAQKMATPQVKKFVGRNPAKERYLSEILTRMGNSQVSHKKSVSDLFNHEAMDTKIIPNICNRIDKYLTAFNTAKEALSKFDGNEENNIRRQSTAVLQKLSILEEELLLNKTAFDTDIKMFEPQLEETIANMSANSHMSSVMSGINVLQKDVTTLKEEIKNVNAKLEQYGYDLAMLGKLDLVDLKEKVESLQDKGLDKEEAELIFASCINNYIKSDKFTSLVQDIVENTQVKVTTKITKNARNSIVNEIYNIIMKDGEIDKETLNDTIRKVVTEIIEKDLKVIPKTTKK